MDTLSQNKQNVNRGNMYDINLYGSTQKSHRLLVNLHYILEYQKPEKGKTHICILS